MDCKECVVGGDGVLGIGFVIMLGRWRWCERSEDEEGFLRGGWGGSDVVSCMRLIGMVIDWLFY